MLPTLKPFSDTTAALLLGILTVSLLLFGWVGFIASDDGFYAIGAQGWQASFPHLGDTHWALRHPFVLPVAVSFSFFGVNEYSLVLVTTGYYLALIFLVFTIIRNTFDATSALISAGFLATVPLLMVWGTIANEDIPEAFFVFLSLWLFYFPRDSRPSVGRLFFAGIAAGLAWWCKETAIGLLLLYGICFVIGFRYQRKAYWVMAAGFSAVWLSEWLYFWIQTGDPLYRIWIDLDQGASSRPAGLISSGATGNIELSRWINPLLALLFNDEFGLLYFLFIPAAIWAWSAKGMTAGQAMLLRLLIGLTLTWIVTIGYLIPLRSLPRYFTVSTVSAATVTAIWLVHAVPTRRALLLAGIQILLGLSLVYVSNREPIWGARQLVELAGESRDEVIYTDPATFQDVEFLLAAQGISNRVRPGLPEGPGLYFYNPNSIGRHPQPPDYSSRYAPGSHMVALKEISPSRKITAILVEMVGLKSVLPVNIWRKLDRQNEKVVLYRSSGR